MDKKKIKITEKMREDITHFEEVLEIQIRNPIFVLGQRESLKELIKNMKEQYTDAELIIMNFKFCIVDTIESRTYVAIQEGNEVYEAVLGTYKKGEYECLKL